MPGGRGAATFEADGDSIEVSYVRPAPHARAQCENRLRVLTGRGLALPPGPDSFAAGVAVTATPGYTGPLCSRNGSMPSRTIVA